VTLIAANNYNQNFNNYHGTEVALRCVMRLVCRIGQKVGLTNAEIRREIERDAAA